MLTAWSSSWNSGLVHRTRTSSLHKAGSWYWHGQGHGPRCDICSCIGPHIQKCPALGPNALWAAILKFLKIFSSYLYLVSEGGTMEYACAGVWGTWLMCSLTSHNLLTVPGWLLASCLPTLALWPLGLHTVPSCPHPSHNYGCPFFLSRRWMVRVLLLPTTSDRSLAAELREIKVKCA